jgi:TPR repeat protein
MTIKTLKESIVKVQSLVIKITLITCIIGQISLINASRGGGRKVSAVRASEPSDAPEEMGAMIEEISHGLQERAREGDPDAQYALCKACRALGRYLQRWPEFDSGDYRATLRLRQEGGERESLERIASFWYKRAFEQRHYGALQEARMSSEMSDAVKVYASEGDPGAMRALEFFAMYYDEKEEEGEWHEKAIVAYQAAADSLDFRAMGNLGWMYYAEEGAVEDRARGFHLIKEAADQGVVEAQRRFGYINGLLANKYEYGTEEEKAHEEVEKQYYQMAAEAGDCEAQSKLGHLLLDVVPSSKSSEGREWLLLAAKQWDYRALYDLGNASRYGWGGILKSPEEARRWYVMADAAYGNYQCSEAYSNLKEMKDEEMDCCALL